MAKYKRLQRRILSLARKQSKRFSEEQIMRMLSKESSTSKPSGFRARKALRNFRGDIFEDLAGRKRYDALEKRLFFAEQQAKIREILGRKSSKDQKLESLFSEKKELEKMLSLLEKEKKEGQDMASAQVAKLKAVISLYSDAIASLRGLKVISMPRLPR